LHGNGDLGRMADAAPGGVQGGNPGGSWLHP
jgi:hypothetical protein